MRLGTRTRIGIAVAAAAVLGGGFGGWYARGLGAAAAARVELPRFTEPGAGPRAPREAAAVFGAAVGTSTAGEVEARLRASGIACQDRGVRAAMQRWRDGKRAEVEGRRARGEAVDTVSGASALERPTRHERNPQVRLSCEGARASLIGDRARPETTGRLLFVFDSPELPLRHASYERTFSTVEAARRDLDAALAAMTARLGAPGKRPDAEGAALPWMRPVSWTWTYADLVAKLTAVNYGGARGVVVGEVTEVPWPVRADAVAAR